MFHSLILGRRKFGSVGWSKKYNFNDGDLTISGDILHNYLSKYEKVPYEDLRYLYGEIMYGGHITDNWDRRTNNTYLEVLIKKEILQQMNLTLTPGPFKSPNPEKFTRADYEKYIEEKLPTETPMMFGLHLNAEISYLTTQGELLFDTILSVSGASSGGGKGSGVKQLIDTFLEQLPADFNEIELHMRAKERPPYIVVLLQEIARMNILMSTIRFSLIELDQGLKGALNITDAMEELSLALSINKVPGNWGAVAYFSNKNLMDWFADMLIRQEQLNVW